MSAIDALIEEVRHLPDAENRRALLGRYGEIGERVEEATRRYGQAELALNTLAALTPGEPPMDIAPQRDALRKAAKELRVFVENGRVSVSSKRDATLVTDIDDRTELCLSLLTEAWSRYFRDRNAGYRQLADAAKSAALPGAVKMQQAVGSLERLVQGLPQSGDIGLAIAAALEEIHGAIERLGLQGRAGQFLIEAARGGASPEMLFEPEVKEFFDKYTELRRLLKVKLA